MKKILFSLSIFFLFALTACSSNDKQEADNPDQNDESLNVDKGLMNVEITLPASMFEGEEIESVLKEAEEEGIKATQNEDGTVTYKMSKAKHKEMMAEMAEGIKETVAEMKNGEDYPSIQDVTYNKDYTEFTVVVDKEAYENSFDGFATMGLAMSGMFYQLYDGVNPDDYQVLIKVKDAATNEVFAETLYPDDLEEAETEEDQAS